ncbi:hypothetical protein H0O02_01180, partial [Candidatus Micrarchaeota archaeon]|nr:hypothetical protein [Candidatus Micrarchaeota archaeon]
MFLSGPSDVKMITTSSGYTFVLKLNGWDTQGTKAYIMLNNVAYTWSENSTYTIGNVNFYVQAVDVNYTGAQEATGSVRISLDQACTASACSMALSGPGSTKIVTTSEGNVYVVKLNGWDTQGTRAYLSVNNVSYSWTEGSMNTVNNALFYLDSVDVSYTGAQEAIGSVKMLLNRDCTQQEATCTDSDGGATYVVKGFTTGINELGATGTHYDVCSSTGSGSTFVNEGPYVVENYCDGGISKKDYWLCPSGFTCRDGACVKASDNMYIITDKSTYSDYEMVKVYTHLPAFMDCNYYFVLPDGTERSLGGGGCFADDYSFSSTLPTLVSGQKPLPGKWKAKIVAWYPDKPDTKYTLYTPVFNVISTISQCTDSDGGKNYYVKGTAAGTLSSANMVTTDICMKDVQGAPLGYTNEQITKGLSEVFCEGNVVKSEVYVCPNGCKEGACLTSSASCGNGICETDEANYCPPCVYSQPACAAPCYQGTCPQDCARKCPSSIELIFNKEKYSPGDYFEVTVKIYDSGRNLTPNQEFNVYSVKEGTSTTYYTDSSGIYRSSSTIPSDPKYNGEWTFVASVSQSGCEYVSDKNTIFINISNKCGDGRCENGEKEIICDTICPQIACATGEKCDVPACRNYCHAACQKDCTPNCGNGVCDTNVCQSLSCPISENERNCPQDCKPVKYCGSMSSDFSCVCEDGYVKESFRSSCVAIEPQKPSTTTATSALASGSGASVTGAVTSASAACTDSDGGKNYYEKGSAKVGSGGLIDDCMGYISNNQTIETEKLLEAICDGNKSTYVTYTCPNGCMNGACVLANQTACTDSDGGKNYYVKGTVIAANFAPSTRTDHCLNDSLNDLSEAYCDAGGFGMSGVYQCPNGCNEGACIGDGGQTVDEQVKCVFANSNSMQECYSDRGFGCRGIETCVADVSGAKGDRITWKSGCGGYAYTTVDGENEYAKFDCAPAMCTYYRCVPAYQNIYLSTDKYAYNIDGQVQISSNYFQKGKINLTELKTSVKGPYGPAGAVTLTQECDTSEVKACPVCVTGEYCPPCNAYASCRFMGTFSGTKSVGLYEISSGDTGTGIHVFPAQFRVYDHSLLKKYLILEDINGFKYVDAQLEPAKGNVMGYMAKYQKAGREYASIVVEFDNGDMLQEFLKEAFRQYAPDERKIGGNYVYVLNTGSQKVYVWTYKIFLIGITEQSVYMSSGVAKATIPTEARSKLTDSSADSIGGMEAKKVSPQVSEDNKNDFLTGMVTGMPVATATAQAKPIERNCGSDSLYPECVCAGDDTKGGFTPPCASSGACDEAKHYRCVPHEPTELIKAYLEKYPSDIRATGTECEQKGGYCISSGDSCENAFAGTGFACKMSSEKCCVKSVDKSDFLDIVMKLESIRVRMDKLERNANALADYYKSTGDTNRANKFSDVAGMFNNGKGMIDDIIA